ncbi:MAG: (Fe-S)-binding protein [Gemmatimonadota bacterium]
MSQADPDQSLLQGLDYSILQKCMHCGMCLPTCPTYVETLQERSSPRGRIAMMRAIADGRMELSRVFAQEMYFCLGCLACETACPAGVDYTNLFEHARAEVERVGILDSPLRRAVRYLLIELIFTSRQRLRWMGASLGAYQRLGLQFLVRRTGLRRLLPGRLRQLEPLTPSMHAGSTGARLRRELANGNPAAPRLRVGLLTGCVQDLAFGPVNADTIAVLQRNGCEVVVPETQQCCGSLHAHNGELELARQLARANIDAFAPEKLDAVVVNAGGCGSHMRHYGRLLAGDPGYAERARIWSSKVRDIHEFLVEVGFRAPVARPRLEGVADPGAGDLRVTYHESCHLKHGQKVGEQPRRILRSIPGVELVELVESDWCCGSAGVYNITQPEMSMKLLDRKMGHVADTLAAVVATANPGCHIQLEHGGRRRGVPAVVIHPISILAAAYRAEDGAGAVAPP